MDLPDRADWFTVDHGMPHPNWMVVNGWRRANVARASLDEFWQCFVRRWLDVLRTACPGHYVQAESENFHFLSELDEKSRIRMLQFLEQSRSHIRKVVGDTAESDWHGKHLVLRFSGVETYYRYIAHYYSDGEHASSAGTFLKSEYCHIVYPASWSMDQEHATLAHEITHNLLTDLPLPRWLDEALAMAFEADLCGSGNEPISRESGRRHREHWNTEAIQHFWTGESFGTPEGQELSYNLARVLLHLIHTTVRPAPDEFRRFVLASDWRDAGAIACRDHLKVELAELAGTFLGPGDWEPKPEAWGSNHDCTELIDQERAEAEEQASVARHGPICTTCGAHARATGTLLGRIIYRCEAGHEFMRRPPE